jgi:hypothetical protein
MKVENSRFKGELHTSKVKLVSYGLDTVNINKKQAIPGPGTYKPNIEINSLGIYHLSNIK